MRDWDFINRCAIAYMQSVSSLESETDTWTTPSAISVWSYNTALAMDDERQRRMAEDPDYKAACEWNRRVKEAQLIMHCGRGDDE